MKNKKIFSSKYISIILIFAFILAGCRKNADWEMMQQSEQIYVQSTEYEITNTEKPVLPDIDYSNMTFFEDGYELAQYESISDGDTASFAISSGTFTARFLAVDTPEVNSSENGTEPWSLAAKEYTRNVLENAKEIVLERDDESDIFDKYDRLLVWVWADGQLLNCDLVEQGLGKVNYIYGDYKYVEYLKEKEEETKSSGIKIWGEDDPGFDYSTDLVIGDIAAIRQQPLGKNVQTEGIVTNVIGTSAFIQDDTGAIYLYTNKTEYAELVPGNKVTVTGKILEYNGLTEISGITEGGIQLVEQGIGIGPMKISLDIVNEDLEGMYVKIENLTVTSVEYQEGQKGYNIYVTDGKATRCIRVDKYLQSYPEPEEFAVGDTFSVVGNVGQYQDSYQIMIGSAEDIFR